MNRRAHEILRYWDGELPGLERFTVDGEPVPSERWQVNRALEGEVVPKEVNHVRTPQGADIILEVSAAPLRDEDGTAVAAAVTFDDLSERERREAFVGERPVRLTPIELRILSKLAEEDRAYSRHELLAAAWDTEFVPDDRSRDGHIANLRRKIEDKPARPKRVLTVRGIGYRLRRT